MDHHESEALKGYLAIAGFAGFAFFFWYLGADDKSMYADMEPLQGLGQAIGDFLRGFGVARDWLQDALSEWLGF